MYIDVPLESIFFVTTLPRLDLHMASLGKLARWSREPACCVSSCERASLPIAKDKASLPIIAKDKAATPYCTRRKKASPPVIAKEKA